MKIEVTTQKFELILNTVSVVDILYHLKLSTSINFRTKLYEQFNLKVLEEREYYLGQAIKYCGTEEQNNLLRNAIINCLIIK